MLPFLDQLSAANRGPVYWDEEWEVRSVAKDRAVVVQNGIAVHVPFEECRPLSDAIEVGRRVGLRLPNERRSPATGSYLAMYGRLFAPATEIIRTYWNVTQAGSVQLVREVTDSLSRTELPFNLKVLTDTSVARCDAAVLYTRLADHACVTELIRPIHKALGSQMRKGVPALAMQIARGLALAEEPQQPTSFGLHRCGILADAIVGAHEAGYRRILERVDFVQERFAANEIDLDQPYRQHVPNAAFEFRWPNDSASHRTTDWRRSAVRAAPLQYLAEGDSSLLEVSLGLAERICKEALWSADRCTWLGPMQTRSGVVHVNLGPDLYGGTSGIGLFLAYLHMVRPSPRLRVTSLAAIEQALATVDRLPASARIGLYGGLVGIALAAAHVALITDSNSALSRARSLARDCASADVGGMDNDLINGLAGAVVGMLSLSRLLNDESLAAAAGGLGDQLLARAKMSARGCSWRTMSQPGNQHLTGFSHGASGIAYAMLDLYSVTGDQRYAEAALQAFVFERAYFDPEACNWRDLRGVSRGRGASSAAPFADAWCHGAPGIAVARLRAGQIIADEDVRAEALLALRTTEASITSALESTSHFSLCHGLAGNADILRLGGHAFAMTPGSDQLPRIVALSGIERYSSISAEWPCLTEGEQALGLLTGLAGVGYFYLRMFDSRVPCVLAPSELGTLGLTAGLVGITS
jgi:hypothetical protein